MKVCAIIAEYNPFHNGHKYQIQQARKKTGADIVLAIMSGNFVQRGGAAIVSAQERAKMAILGGADIVIQLPTVFSTLSAEHFAYGAVKTLNSLPIQYLCFGAEDDNLQNLQTLANFLKQPTAQYTTALQEHLSQGHSYPFAVREALKNALTSGTIYNTTQAIDTKLAQTLTAIIEKPKCPRRQP